VNGLTLRKPHYAIQAGGEVSATPNLPTLQRDALSSLITSPLLSVRDDRELLTVAQALLFSIDFFEMQLTQIRRLMIGVSDAERINARRQIIDAQQLQIVKVASTRLAALLDKIEFGDRPIAFEAIIAGDWSITEDNSGNTAWTISPPEGSTVTQQ
jgi:hypothetical protein